MDAATNPFLTRAELIEALRFTATAPETWDGEWPAELLAHAGAERLSTDALAALAAARCQLQEAMAAMQRLDRAMARLADALEGQL